MTDPRPLLVVGELCVDLIVLLDDSELRFDQHEQLVTSTTLTMGSSSAITACAAARLGVPTSLVAVRGDDVFGRFLGAELAKRGVTEAGRIDPDAVTGSSTHLSRPEGDRAILTAMGSIGAVTAADVSDELLRGSGHLHVGSYFLQESLWDDAAELFRRARELGLSTSLDGNFDPSQRWDRGILQVIAHCDVLFGNQQEISGITRLPGEEGIDALLQRMPAGAGVVYKRGADGATLARRVDGVTVMTSARPPSVDGPLIDTVGAGDNLAAGFIAGRLRGLGLEQSLALGVACGTASTRAAGGTGAQLDFARASELAARSA